MMLACTNNEQKVFIVKETFQAVCGELAQVIKQKDGGAMASIIETMAEMMPFMSQQMMMRMPNMMMAVLNMVKSETAEV